MCQLVRFWRMCNSRPGRIWGSRRVYSAPERPSTCKCDGPFTGRNPQAWCWGNEAGWYEARPECPLHGRVEVKVGF
jgi:hypothetical protein